MPTLVADQSASERVLADRTTVLSPAAARVMRGLALTSEEAFLLSRVEQPMPVSHVLASSGLPEGQAIRLLLALVEKGALLAPGATGNQASSKWGTFVFSPGELGEDVDLDPDQRKEILFRFHTLDQTSHWRLLGVAVDAPIAEVRRAYLERTKVFHPDLYFSKRMGSYLPRVEAIFQRLTLAWETLSDDESRAHYERTGRAFTAEEKAQLANREIARLEAEKRTRARRERLLRVKGFVRLTKAREELAAGDRALAAGNIGEANGHYSLALELDPRLEEARARLAEAQRVALARRADQTYEEACKAEENLQFRRAIELLKDAGRYDPSNARVQLALGRLLFQDDPKAAKLARGHVVRALELGLRSGAAHLIHGELLLELKQKKLARQQLELAAQAGEQERARVLLKKC